MPSKPSTSKAPAMSFPGTVKRALSSADVSSVPVSVNAQTGSFQVVMITTTPVRRIGDDPAPVRLARGRLVPLATGMSEATIELTFRSLPPDSVDILTAAADALRIGKNRL